MTGAALTTATQRTKVGARQWITLALVLIVAALSYIDRQIFTLFQERIKVELALSDTQLGLLTGMSFAVFYALAAFPVARYADRGDRRLVISVSVIVWSAATALCGIATSFWTMLAARIGLASGEAGAGPASQALLADLFPPEKRVTVISSMLAANSVGLAGGLALGGWLSNFFSWRQVFLVVGLPGILIGLIVWFVAQEPRKLTRGQAKEPSIAFGAALALMWKSVSLRWVALLLTTVPVTGFGFLIWSPSFFQRVHKMSVEQTGFWLGGATLAGLVAGNLLAGWLGDRYGKSNPRFNGWLAAAGLFAAFPCALLFALTPDANVSLGCFVALKFLMTLHLGPVIALCFAQVPSTMRAVMMAVINMFIGLAGTGIGGTLAGVLSDAYGRAYGIMSLRYSLATISVGLLVGGAAALMASRTATPLKEG